MTSYDDTMAYVRLWNAAAAVSDAWGKYVESGEDSDYGAFEDAMAELNKVVDEGTP